MTKETRDKIYSPQKIPFYIKLGLSPLNTYRAIFAMMLFYLGLEINPQAYQILNAIVIAITIAYITTAIELWTSAKNPQKAYFTKSILIFINTMFWVLFLISFFADTKVQI